MKKSSTDQDRGEILIDYDSLMAWIERLPDNRRAKKIADAVKLTAKARAAKHPKIIVPGRGRTKEPAHA